MRSMFPFQRGVKQQSSKLGLPLPNYSKEGDSLVLTIYRTFEAITASLAKDVRESFSEAEAKGWEFIMSRTGTTQSEYAKELEVTARTAQRHLTHFVELGLLKRIGKEAPLLIGRTRRKPYPEPSGLEDLLTGIGGRIAPKASRAKYEFSKTSATARPRESKKAPVHANSRNVVGGGKR